MFITDFYTEQNDLVVISREQASRFAKEIADDFNPIHDENAKRFCVPGDLLFAIVLARSGISQKMEMRFQGMVADNLPLLFPCCHTGEGHIADQSGKEYVNISRQGDVSRDPLFISSLIRSYVEFSGHCFPHVFVELMREKGVMINPARPMVMYEKMAIELDCVQSQSARLSLASSSLQVDGKRGNAEFRFDIFNQDNQVVGHGIKYMILGGLIAFDEPAMADLVDYYAGLKQGYLLAS